MLICLFLPEPCYSQTQVLLSTLNLISFLEREITDELSDSLRQLGTFRIVHNISLLEEKPQDETYLSLEAESWILKTINENYVSIKLFNIGMWIFLDSQANERYLRSNPPGKTQ